MRNSRNPRPRGQTGHLNERVLIEVEGLCEAFKKTLWRVFMYPQEHLNLSLIWPIARLMSKGREGNG